jgi:hypothetical protein
MGMSDAEQSFQYLRALDQISAAMETCKCPLSNKQRIILASSLAIWVPEPAMPAQSDTKHEAK